jgi:hypothetical protein
MDMINHPLIKWTKYFYSTFFVFMQILFTNKKKKAKSQKHQKIILRFNLKKCYKFFLKSSILDTLTFYYLLHIKVTPNLTTNKYNLPIKTSGSILSLIS